QCAYQQARRATAPILELGSGLSTVIMGASATAPLHAIEADLVWVDRTRAALARFKIEGVIVHHCRLQDGWYVLPDDLPHTFGLVLIDGPQGNREQAFRRLGERIMGATVMCDDVLGDPWTCSVYRWGWETGRRLEHISQFVVS